MDRKKIMAFMLILMLFCVGSALAEDRTTHQMEAVTVTATKEADRKF